MEKKNNIQNIWLHSYSNYCDQHPEQTAIQKKASSAIMKCKTGKLGRNTTQCSECGYTEIHNNSCRNRNCPNCQAVQKEIWVDKRSAEVIDAPYFHIVFTLPHELNPLLYCNQKLLYALLHKCCADTILELSADEKFLGAVPGIIQVLHTWNQTLDYHVHMHCIVSGGGLTSDQKIRKTKKNKFFIPVKVLRNKFRGKFLDGLEKLYSQKKLVFSKSCGDISNYYSWKSFRNNLYETDWCPYIKETFNGFGNAIEYLGRYTHKIAISNNRILSVTEEKTTFTARSLKKGDKRRQITLDNTEFIRRYLMHVLPSGFQKIRYYGYLNNRNKTKNLKLIFKLQGHQRFKRKYEGMSAAQIIKIKWKADICKCPECGCPSMKTIQRTYSETG